MPARLSRRAAAEPVEERPGSGQSPASRAKDLAAQPALLAGIAKKAPIKGGKRVSKKTYSFVQAAAARAASSTPGRAEKGKTSKARLVFARAEYQTRAPPTFLVSPASSRCTLEAQLTCY